MSEDATYEKVDITIDDIEEAANRLLPVMRDAGMFDSPATAYALMGAAMAFLAASSGTLENFKFGAEELKRFWDDQLKSIIENWDDEERAIVRETASTPRH